jgi:hypothetical protein
MTGVDKYHLFTQFMYNELGISKDDIKQWVHDTVYEVASTYVENEFSRQSLDSRIQAIISHRWSQKTVADDIKREVANVLVKNFDIVWKEPPKE